MNYYLITFENYGKTRKDVTTFSEIKKESIAWDCCNGNRNSIRDLIKAKYVNVVSVVKTTSYNKYLNFKYQ